MSFLLFLLILPVTSQPYLPHGLSNILISKLDFSKVERKVSPQCASESGMFFNSIKKSLKILETCTDSCFQELQEHTFALKQLDASGKLPPGISDWVTVAEGSYETCQELDGEKYPTNYYYLHLVPGKNSICPSESESNAMKLTMKLAICAPESCSSNDIVEIFNAMQSQFIPIPLTACRTFCVKNSTASYSLGFWLFAIFMIAMILICISATVLNYYWSDTEVMDVRLKALLCFSFSTNIKLLLEQKPEIPGVQLRGLNFLKFWCVVWVIIGHSPLNFILGDTVKPLIATRDYLTSHLVLDAMYSVETFFLITGVLLGFGIFKNPDSLQLLEYKSTWLKIVVRRYIRLMAPLVPWLGVVAFSALFVRGPVISSLENYLDFLSMKCANGWWKLLFMTHNTWRPGDSCYPISWYVASDFQFFLLAPFIVLPLSHSRGIKTIGAIISISVVATFVTFWHHQLGPFFYTMHNLEEFLTYFHQQTFPRIPTFVMGILMGRHLAFHKSPILLQNPTKIWTLAAIGFFFCFYGKHLAVKEGIYQQANYHFLFSASHHFFHVLLWDTVVLWVIYACQFELGPTVTRVLNHTVWQPFGRLTYCIYIVHWLMFYYVLNLSDRALHFVSMWKMILEVSVPTLLLCIPVAMIWSAMFEIPVTRLEKLLMAVNRKTE